MRPSKYDPAVHPVIALAAARLGATNPDIAAAIGIDPATLKRWRRRHPELAEAVAGGKRLADAEVTNALYKRATGFAVVEVDETYEVDPDGSERLVGRTVRHRHEPPNMGAMAFWLANRQPDLWRHVRHIDARVSSDDSTFLAATKRAARAAMGDPESRAALISAGRRLTFTGMGADMTALPPDPDDDGDEGDGPAADDAA